MRVEIDSHSGFCFGVVRAISRAEEALQEQGEVFSLGDIVHNRVEVQRLERLGMHTVTPDQMPELGGASSSGRTANLLRPTGWRKSWASS